MKAFFDLFKPWFGEWKSDSQYQADLSAAYDANLAKTEVELNRRRKVAIENLGEKWIMHPVNHIKRKV